MKDFIALFERFLFDIIGILIPGLFFTIIFLMPYILVNTEVLDNRLIMEIIGNFPFISAAIIMVVIYIIGTSVKVLSIIQYSICSKVFDPIAQNIKTPKCRCNCKIIIYFYDILEYIVELICRILTFQSPKYSENFEDYYTKCKSILLNRYDIKIEKWYSLYKLSTIIIRTNNIESLSERFLAKYNFYRSMAFVFLFAIVYFAINSYILGDYFCYIILCLLVLWYCFHYKFKRYWTLCGDDALMTLFYYLEHQE